MNCRKGSQRFWGRPRCSVGSGDDQCGGRAGNGRYRKHEWEGRLASRESATSGALELRGTETCGLSPGDQGSLGQIQRARHGDDHHKDRQVRSKYSKLSTSVV